MKSSKIFVYMSQHTNTSMCILNVDRYFQLPSEKVTSIYTLTTNCMSPHSPSLAKITYSKNILQSSIKCQF